MLVGVEGDVEVGVGGFTVGTHAGLIWYCFRSPGHQGILACSPSHACSAVNLMLCVEVFIETLHLILYAHAARR